MGPSVFVQEQIFDVIKSTHGSIAWKTVTTELLVSGCQACFLRHYGCSFQHTPEQRTPALSKYFSTGFLGLKRVCVISVLLGARHCTAPIQDSLGSILNWQVTMFSTSFGKTLSKLPASFTSKGDVFGRTDCFPEQHRLWFILGTCLFMYTAFPILAQLSAFVSRDFYFFRPLSKMV